MTPSPRIISPTCDKQHSPRPRWWTRSVVDPAANEAELVADLLDDAIRVELELEHDSGLVVVQAVECDGAGVGGAARRVPGDPLVGMLLGDLRVPLTPDATDVGHPAQMRLVDLGDRLDAVHEAWEILELGPLVVGGANRNLDVDRFLDGAHRANTSWVGGEACANHGLLPTANS